MTKMRTIEEIQELLDNLHGKGEWTILTYEGGTKPCTLEHKCGEVKTIKFANGLRRGTTRCKCDPTPKSMKEFYESSKIKKEELQADIDKIYGEGNWTIVDFKDMSSPLTLEHNCGELKTISRASTIRRGVCTCVCELKMNM